MAKIIDLTGLKFGKLTVIEKAVVKNASQVWWKCKCECGREKNIQSNSLRGGFTKSCECSQYDRKSIRKYDDPMIGSARNVYFKYKEAGLSFDDFFILSQQNCYYCDLPPENIYNAYRDRKLISENDLKKANFVYSGLDRIDASMPHTIDNVVPCCRQCNFAKLDYSLDEFRNWMLNAYDFLNKNGWK